MWGQWIGTIAGTNKGKVSLSIDRDSPYIGRIVVGDFDLNISPFHAKTTWTQKGNQITAELTEFTPFYSTEFSFFITLYLLTQIRFQRMDKSQGDSREFATWQLGD